MEFVMIWDWMNEDDGSFYEQRVDFFPTKEQLLEAKKKAEKEYKWHIEIGRLILTPAISYCWADIERLF